MPEEAHLDMALDDLVQGDRSSKGRGKGNKGGGKSWNYWGKGSNGGARGKGKQGKGKRSSDDKENDKENKPEKAEKAGDGAKLDMSLEEVIDSEKGKGKGKRTKGKDSEGKGNGKTRGKGKSDWGNNSGSGGSGGNSWKGGGGWNGGEGGWNSDRKGSKGSSKGTHGKSDRGSYAPATNPAWNQHDDRDDDDDSHGKGKGSYGKGSYGKSSWGGRGGKGDRDEWSPPRRSERESLGPRGWSDNERRDTGVWQRVEQVREAPIRDSRRGREEEREVRGRDVRSSKVAESRSAPQKRRAVEEPEGARSLKSVKVTNIPRDVNVQDIRDAFEQETGKITRCRLDRGTAWIAFQTAGAARKAVDTFDRGELNGQNIGVVLAN